MKKEGVINPESGEKQTRGKFRVVRFENHYREKNSPFVEFPAKYITCILQALASAGEIFDKEVAEDEEMGIDEVDA